MPHSLKSRIKSLCYKGEITEKERDKIIKALEQRSHLKGRPCEVCEFHSDNGCSRWRCVFEEVQDE